MVDRDAALAEAAGAELGAPWSASYDDALADPAVAAVVVATPTPLHAQMVERAAAAGKHVFCEKPLSLDVESGRAATDAAAAAGVVLQVGFQRRFDPDFLAAKALIDAGEVGELRLLRISHRNRVPPHAGDLGARLGSPFVDMTVHDFDTARWLAGELAVVSAFTGAGSGVVVGRFESGALAVIDNTRAAGYGFECAVELLGADSTLRIGWSPGAGGVERLTPRGRVSPLPDDHVERHRRAYLERAAPLRRLRSLGHGARGRRRGLRRGARAVARGGAMPAVAVVTGATSGIGRACAELFAARGWGVAGVGRDPGALARLEEELGGSWLGVRGDVADPDVSRTAVTAAVERFGRVDAVVGNAGMTLAKLVGDTTEAELDRLIAVNVKALVHLAQAAHEPLCRTRGSYVVVASNKGLVAQAGSPVYVATKGAAVQLARALALDWARGRNKGERGLPGARGHARCCARSRPRRPIPTWPGSGFGASSRSAGWHGPRSAPRPCSGWRRPPRRS